MIDDENDYSFRGVKIFNCGRFSGLVGIDACCAPNLPLR